MHTSAERLHERLKETLAAEQLLDKQARVNAVHQAGGVFWVSRQHREWQEVRTGAEIGQLQTRVITGGPLTCTLTDEEVFFSDLQLAPFSDISP